MQYLDPQGLCPIQLRRPHITGPIADEQLVYTFRPVVVESDPLIIDLEHLAGFQLVVDNHLAIASNESAAYLNRRQPVNMEVCNQMAIKKTVQIRYVFWLTHDVRHSHGRD